MFGLFARKGRREARNSFLPGGLEAALGPGQHPPLLTPIPAPFGLPKGHSPLLTAAFCLGNTSWDVLSRVRRAGRGLCQATTIDLSLQPSGPGKSPRSSWRKRQTGSKCLVPGCPCPLLAVSPCTASFAQQLCPRAGEMRFHGAEVPVQLLCFENIQTHHPVKASGQKTHCFWRLCSKDSEWLCL